MQYVLPHNDATCFTDIEHLCDAGSITFGELEKCLPGDYAVQVAMIRDQAELRKK
jgi:hypothetical protein